MTLTDFLVWVSAGGSVLAVSFIMERIDWFQKLESKTKELIMFMASAVLAMGAIAVQQFVPVATLNAMAPYFASVAGIFGMIFLAKAFHKVDKITPPADDSKG
jgi:hypothetical protein